MTKLETPSCGQKWYAIILKVEGPVVRVRCMSDWNQFLVHSSYVDDWYVNKNIAGSSTIDIREIGDVEINLLVKGNGLIMYPKFDPSAFRGRPIELFCDPLFVVRPMVKQKSSYDINKFIYKFIGRELLAKDPKLTQNDIDILISRCAEEYSWCCQYENSLQLTFDSDNTPLPRGIKPHHNNWRPKESKFKGFLSNWYRDVLEVQINVWGASTDWGRGAWYTLKTLQTKPWKVPISKKRLTTLSNYYGLKITGIRDILHDCALKFQSSFKYGHSYTEEDVFKTIDNETAQLIKNNSDVTDLIVIEREDMPIIVTWKHCKIWHDAVIDFFQSNSKGEKGPTEALGEGEGPTEALGEGEGPTEALGEGDVSEFTLINSLRSSDGTILQGPAGSGKSTLLVRLSNAINSMDSCAVSMAYTGKAAKVLRNKGIEAVTIHSFLHTTSIDLSNKYWNRGAQNGVQGQRETHCQKKQHILTDNKLLETGCKDYMDYEKFKSSKSNHAQVEQYRQDNHEQLQNYKDILGHPFIIVDEASMLGARMMFMLLTKISKLSRRIGKSIKVVLIGDKEQLPPVKDLNIFEILQTICPVAYLTKVHRIKESGPLLLSQRCITDGISMTDIRQVISGDTSDVHVAKFDNSQLNQFSNFMKTHKCIFISPYKKIVRDINRVVTNGRSEETRNRWRIGDKVMITSNMSFGSESDPVVNGDMGTILATDLRCDELVTMRPDLKYLLVKNSPEKKISCLFLYVQGSKRGVVLYKANEKAALTFAYCVTIHKSQGSEWNDVFVCLQGIDKVTSFLNRSILYTAITRTQQKLVIVGECDTIIGMSTNRPSPLRSLLNYYNGVRVTRYKVQSDDADDFFGDTNFEDAYEPDDEDLLDECEFDF